MSHPFASRYLDQFPKVKMARVARFVAFVAGAVVRRAHSFLFNFPPCPA